jgi:ring-1,2-phenylacetyl-CoA epoxidase subunit PaaB
MIPLNEPIIDPRIKRLDVESTYGKTQVGANEEWITWEVFHQKKRGEQHEHVGIVHAPDAQLALVFAKEQYGRRLKSANIWVVKSSDIFSFSYDDQDMFETAPEKLYREAGGYKVRDKINQYKKEQKAKAESGSH